MPGGRAKRGRAQAADPTAAGTHDDAHDDAPASGMTALHRWRSPPWRVAAATALSACPDGSAVAAAYEDGRVEVWHLSYLCRLMVRAAGWRFFSLGGGGRGRLRSACLRAGGEFGLERAAVAFQQEQRMSTPALAGPTPLATRIP
jgi:hypothetical protein